MQVAKGTSHPNSISRNSDEEYYISEVQFTMFRVYFALFLLMTVIMKVIIKL